MKHWLFLMLLPLNAFSSGNFWQCTARDVANNEWKGDSEYKLSAINKSFDACKKASEAPQTCKTSQQDCEPMVNGVSTRPLWHCTAYDQMAAAWESNLYQQRDDAAIAAKAYCEQSSGFPDTCFINLMTCNSVTATR